jgi:sarcosine oxidase
MSDSTFDVIVIGVGGMGSAAIFELARRGRRVLGLEQLPLGHDQGSSHGHTRIIRKSYYEDPDYVPLVSRAYQRWYDLEQREGRHLLTECPCLSIGPPDSAMVQGVLRSAAEHSLPVEVLDGAGLRRTYPAFHFGDDHVAVLERTAGFLFVDDCVQAHARQALQLGAALHENEPVESWQADGSGVRVQTRTRRYTADRLVLTAGPWAGQLLGRHGRRLSVMRQVVFWVGTDNAARFRRDLFPVYIAETSQGHFYGLPALDANGLKVARHYGAPELPDPSAVDRTVSAADEEPVRAFLRAHLPEADGPVRRASVCLYTLTPDRHFLIDVHPEHGNVVFAAGFSGHGFKFASVVGEVLADLAEKGRTDLPVARFRLVRFANSGGA